MARHTRVLGEPVSPCYEDSVKEKGVLAAVGAVNLYCVRKNAQCPQIDVGFLRKEEAGEVCYKSTLLLLGRLQQRAIVERHKPHLHGNIVPAR